ncbi:unnamed protein product [Moneuplotes crassus]|uniref:Uncharacterized protein n=1 Tax=Euplotes crassus TaxID=5936 RepID=A0AAD1X5S6_EUPCR|nr:unnamed protein product [Moneuplotes crassus]
MNSPHKKEHPESETPLKISQSEFPFCSNTEIKKFKDQMIKKKESEIKEKFDELEDEKNSNNCSSKPSPYRYRKDVCYKFILRKFKNYYTKDFTEATNFTSKHKNRDERVRSLKLCMLNYCGMRGLLERSAEFPFLLSSFLFPKYSREIIDSMIEESSDPNIKEKLELLKKIIDLLKNLVKNYSEIKLKKVVRIPEIRYLLLNFIRRARQGEIEISGMIKEDPEKDREYLKKIIKNFYESVDSQVQSIRNSNCMDHSD